MPIQYPTRFAPNVLSVVATVGMLACAPKVTDISQVPTLAAQAPEPVYFRHGTADIAAKADEEQISRVITALQADKRQTLFLAGYADPTGSEGANLTLSQARAAVVAERITKEGGIDEKRVIVRGMGELDRSGRTDADLRRVDFLFVKQGLIPTKDNDKVVEVLIEAGLIDPSARLARPPVGTPASAAAGTPTDANGTGERIVLTGLSDVDAVFAQVQGLLDLVQGAKADIAAGEDALRSALHITADGDLSEALQKLKADARGNIRIERVDGHPKLTAAGGASPEVTRAVTAINQFVGALARATRRLAQVPKQAQAIVAQAKTLPGAMPNMLKEAGLSAKELPKMIRPVKTNVRLTATVPKECAEVGKQAASTFKLVASTFT